jgi:antibiotic biosynthesis monooxygenase (ABM) superfamily enzyme
MTKKIDELRNMPQKSEVYFKEFEQVGSITNQVYHFKFKTEEEYNLWLESQKRIESLIDRLDNL